MFAAARNPFRPERRRTRVVRVGDVEIGGDNPIRIQSMTNTDTMDTDATVAQIARLAEAGCEIVRVTAPSIRDAENLREIRRRLAADRIDVPLVADIHFTPNAALIAAEWVEKVRINPGNYADKKKFEVREYDDAQYEAEIARVAERFRPLVLRCRENGVAMRIGTNHGSLSDRILNRFGDTAEGMVESALEFLDVCEAESYFDIVFSMKASNTQVAIQAYRLLAARLEARRPGEPSYPFHVGVTEAGDAEDGRIKSAIGIGSLLEDGLGDTIRVSLTEDPVREVPVARLIAERAAIDVKRADSQRPPIRVESPPVPDFFSHARRQSEASSWSGLSVGGDAPVAVELELPDSLVDPLADPGALAARLATDLSALRDIACESILVSAGTEDAARRAGILQRELASLGVDVPISLRLERKVVGSAGLLGDAPAGPLGPGARLGRLVCVVDTATDSNLARLRELAEVACRAGVGIEWELDGEDHAIPTLVAAIFGDASLRSATIAASLAVEAPVQHYRVLVSALADVGAARCPVVLRQAVERGEPGSMGLDVIGANAIPERALVEASIRLGSLLCDGIGDAVSMQSSIGAAPAVDLAYRVLQGARQRTTRTEYISCPSCGRTLFDLEETTARIKARTDHLKGVKIAVMGCIVNGPGEMADADFGYVGSGVGQVTLYVGQEVVARAVPEAEATDRLVDLIREHGQWVEGEVA